MASCESTTLSRSICALSNMFRKCLYSKWCSAKAASRRSPAYWNWFINTIILQTGRTRKNSVLVSLMRCIQETCTEGVIWNNVDGWCRIVDDVTTTTPNQSTSYVSSLVGNTIRQCWGTTLARPLLWQHSNISKQSKARKSTIPYCQRIACGHTVSSSSDTSHPKFV